MTSWKEIEESEKDSILERLREIYEEHNYPNWLKNPEIVEEFGNILCKNE